MGWNFCIWHFLGGGLLSVVVRIWHPLFDVAAAGQHCIAGLGTACISGWQI